MDPELLRLRGIAGDRHDAALVRHPTRLGPAFRAELESVIFDLREVLARANPQTTDPVERARTLGWIGAAYFDLGRGVEDAALLESAQYYLEAERIAAGEEAPLVKAKLDNNFANTLRGQSQGTDVALLEQAELRYERALRAFRQLGESAFAREVSQSLESLRGQLSLAREAKRMQRELAELTTVQSQLSAMDALERDAISARLGELRSKSFEHVATRAASEANRLRAEVLEHPERFPDAPAKLAELDTQIAAFASFAMPSDEPPEASERSLHEGILTALRHRLAKDAERGAVTAHRASALSNLLDGFATTLGTPAADLAGMQARSSKMLGFAAKAGDFVLQPSTARSAATPRATALQELSLALKRQVLAESLRLGGASNSADFFAELAHLEARMAEAPRAEELEPELWAIARRFQEHRRLEHAYLAQPRWPRRSAKHSPKSVFVSGPASDACIAGLRARGHEILLETRGVYADGRWNQLVASTVSLFWLTPVPAEGDPDETNARQELAQTCYELGAAIAAGASIVVAVSAGANTPFDVPVLQEYVRSDFDVDRVIDAVERAAFESTWGGLAEGRDARARLLHEYESRYLGETRDDIAWRMLRQSEDPLDFFNWLQRTVQGASSLAPQVLLPAWPGRYATEPVCFHVTAFRDWSKATSAIVEETCREHGARYVRGDRSAEQRIDRAIWDGLTAASTVLIDITNLNPNVALELGMTHAIGKPYRLVYNRDVDADGRRELRLFRSIERDQVHGYSSSGGLETLRDVTKELLATPQASTNGRLTLEDSLRQSGSNAVQPKEARSHGRG
jgi:hypothetical protein